MREQSYKPNFKIVERGPTGERIVAGAESILVARAAFDAACMAMACNTELTLQHGARIIVSARSHQDYTQNHPTDYSRELPRAITGA